MGIGHSVDFWRFSFVNLQKNIAKMTVFAKMAKKLNIIISSIKKIAKKRMAKQKRKDAPSNDWSYNFYGSALW